MKFSIRTTLLFSAWLAILLAGPIGRNAERARLTQSVEQTGGEVGYTSAWSRQRQWNKYPKVFSQVAGWEFWAHIHTVRLTVDQRNSLETLAASRSALDRCDRLFVSFKEGRSRVDLQPLRHLDIPAIELFSATLDREDFRTLAEVESLEVLWLVECTFDVEALTELKESSKLAWLRVGSGKDRLLRGRELLPFTYVSQ